MSLNHDHPEIYFWDRGTLRAGRDAVLMKQEAQGSESFIGNMQEISIRPYRTRYTHVQTMVSSKQTDHKKSILWSVGGWVSNPWPIGHKQLQKAMKGPMVLRPLELN